MNRRPKKFLKVFIGLTILCFSIRAFLIEDFRVSSDSMEPNLLRNDLVWVFKGAFNLRFPFSSFELASWRRPQRFDLVAFSLVENASETLVKRVIGLAGDKVEIREGILRINDQEPKLIPLKGNLSEENWEENKQFTIQGQPSSFGPVIIPDNHFFVLGDARNNSIDSRNFGPLPYSVLKGKIFLVLLSFGEGGSLRKERMFRMVSR